MTSQFELFIASRYLRAHRKEKVISIITVISMLGVAVGVMALVMALGVNNGFRDTLQKNLLGAMAHIEVVPKVPGDGIENWQEVAANLRNVPHVTAVSPAVYSDIYIAGPLRPVGGEIKGINPDSELTIGDSLRNLKAGSIDRLRDQNANPPPIVVGSEMAEYTGMKLNSIVNVMTPYGELTPYGPKFTARRFRVVGIFETGFYEVDAHWAFTSILAAQKLLSTGDLVNDIQINVDDLHRAEELPRR